MSSTPQVKLDGSEIDLSSGFVPKEQPAIDLSGGLVPTPPSAQPFPTQPVKPAPVQLTQPLQTPEQAAATSVARKNIAQYPENQPKPNPDYVQRKNSFEAVQGEPGAPQDFEYDPEQERLIKAQEQVESQHSMVPQAAIPALDVANRYAVQPFEKASQAGAQYGREVGEAEVSQPAESNEFITPDPRALGVARGAGSVVGGVAADPRMWPLFFMGPEASAAKTAMSAGFATQMGVGAYEQAGELGKIMDNPDVPQEDKWEAGANMVLSTLMAAQAGGHAATPEVSARLQEFQKLPPTDQEGIRNVLRQKAPEVAAEVDKTASAQAAAPKVTWDDEQKPAAKPERFRLPRGTSAQEVQGSVKGPNIRTVQVGDKTYAFDQRRINADGVTSAVERNELWRLTGGKAPEAAKVQAEADVRGEEAPAVEKPAEQQAAPEVKWDDEVEKPDQALGNEAPVVPQESQSANRYDAAKRLAMDFGKASPSLLQRHLGIEHGEAASYINRMEDDGIVKRDKDGVPQVVKFENVEETQKEEPRINPYADLSQEEKSKRLFVERTRLRFLESSPRPDATRITETRHHISDLGGDAAPERRTDLATRKRVADLTPDERAHELLTSPKTGLPNDRAFEEDAHALAESHPHVGYADLDDFKRYNDALGHEGVDKAVLPAVGDLFRDAAAKEPGGSVKVYHRSGDEFNFRSATPEAIKRVTERVNKELAETTFKYETKDGRILEKKGTGLSHGIGTDHESAEENSHTDKQRRKELGLREGSRDVPAVDTRGAAGEQTAVRENTERERVPGKPAEEVKPAPRTTSPAEVNLRNAKQYTPAERISGHEGNEAKLLTPSGGHAVRYRVVESGDLKTSHRSMDFSRNKDYPEGVQERQYHTSKEAQSRVIQQAQNYDPAYTINTNPDAVNGPPVVTPDGLVLGGNSRAMSTDRLYRSGRGNQYKGALIAQADQFGLDKEAVRGMNRPVLVRELTEVPKGIDELRRLGSDLNKSMTGALGVNERAASAGKSVTPETLSEISRMVNDGGDGATLRDVIRQNGKEIVRMMVKDGVITDRERPQFVDTSTGGLSDEGKTFVERALMGSVVDEPGLMDRAPKAVLAKLEGSLADIASLASRTDEYNLLPILRQALEDHAEIAQSGSTVEDHLAQTGMFAPERNPAVDAMVRALARKPREFREAMKSFAADANHDVQGQSSLGFGERPSASAAFNASFGTDFTEDQFTESLLQSLEKGGTIGAEKKDVERAERTPAEVAESVHHDTPAPEAAGRTAGSEETGRAEPAKEVVPAAGSPEYESLKQKLAALEIPNRAETPPKPGPGIQRVIDRLRTVADGLDKQIEDKQRSMTSNPTPKRMREYRSRLHDGENIKRVQLAMRALADAHEAGTVPKGLENLRTKDEIYRLAYKGVEGGGGYYDVIPSQDYANKTPQGRALQELMERHKNEPSEAKAEREKASKISQLEADVQFQKLPGYFPTPKPVVEKMLDVADIQPGDKVLEPSAGKGNIADLIKEREPEAKLSTIEPQSKLRQILELKGHELADSDFLGHKGEYNKIVMNPPFENGQDIDHVQHAFTLLKPGGKLVAIMSESPFFRNDRKGQAFREWLEEHDGSSEKLEPGAFKESGTGVNARMVEIEKPSIRGGDINEMHARGEKPPDLTATADKSGKPVGVGAKAVPLTPKELDAVDWALDPMRDFWADTEDRGGDYPIDVRDIAKREGKEFSINTGHPDSKEILDDLLYRLERQTKEIGDPEVISEDRSFVRNAPAAAKKIRQAIKPSSGERGSSTPSAMPIPALIASAAGVIKKGSNLYHGAVDKALDWAHMGQTRPEIRKFDPDAADLATKMDAGGPYHKAVAEMIGKKVTGPLAEEFTKADNYASRQKKNEISRDRMKGFHFLADAQNREWLEENHPEDFHRWSADPKIKEALDAYKPFEGQLRDAVKQLGVKTIDEDYIKRIMDFATSGVAYEKGLARGVEGPVELRQGAAAGARGGGRDNVVSPQIDRSKARKDAGKYYWDHGVFDFGPSFEKRWVEVQSKLDEHRLAVHSMSMGTRMMPDEAMPEKVFYNGQEFYRADIAKEIREAQRRGVSAESKALADALGVSELPTPKDVREYATYEPLRRGSRFETAARNLAVNVLAGKEGLEAQAANVNRMAKLRYALPKEIVEALNDAGGEKAEGAVSKAVRKVLGPLTNFIRQQIVGVAGFVHLGNLLRRAVQFHPGGAINPVSWVKGFKVMFDKQLEARGISGTEDPMYDLLLRNAGISHGHIQEYKRYIEGNFDASNWEWTKTAANSFRKGGRVGAGVTPLSAIAGVPRLALEALNRTSERGHHLLFRQGGPDTKLRLYIGDYLKDNVPGITENQIAHAVNNAAGRYNRASWTNLQKSLAPLMVFPGWTYASANWVLKHPFKTAMAPAVVTLLLNQALYYAGKNRREDKNDMLRLHMGRYSVRTNLMTDNTANHIFGWALRGTQAALDGKSKKEATGEMLKEGVSGLGSETVGEMNPIMSGIGSAVFNRRFPSTQEIAPHGDFHKKGKVLPNKAAEDYAAFGARKLFPIVDKVSQPGERPSLASFAGSAGVSVTEKKKKKR